MKDYLALFICCKTEGQQLESYRVWVSVKQHGLIFHRELMPPQRNIQLHIVVSGFCFEHLVILVGKLRLRVWSHGDRLTPRASVLCCSLL